MDTINAHIGKELYKTTITAGTNTLLADEPESMGGQNLGFAPQELFASSLAACTIITLRMYADRKGWDLTDVKIEVTFERDIPANITKLERKIEFTGNLDEAQRARLRVIADSCPIHKALSNPIAITTTIL
ncbi:OsmC family protein [Flavobacterium inviolabile]|uniref:OsmC family protein n=1 Tax=Flavobacterium inviolabile TaxID=2748320 RepID=UPI0015AAE72B|nr:OsmC family protein [Flavobacterium inviolabile]HRB73328.1 OsmC family protein [Flavobacterium sp.]